MTAQQVSLSDAASLVSDGMRIGFGGGNALFRRPMAFARELVRQERRQLHLFNMIAGIEADLLLGAGALASTNCCYFGLDDFGQSNHFQRAARQHSIDIVEYSEFTFVAGLRAANMALPFLPWKTAWGSDVVTNLGWSTVRCPYTGTELVAVPATNLDVAVIQAERADEHGNVEISLPLDFIYDFDYLIARAAKEVIVCVEEIGPLRDPTRTGLIGREVTCVVHTPRGAWPGGYIPHYQPDAAHMADDYVPATASPELFAEYIDTFVRTGERHG